MPVYRIKHLPTGLYFTKSRKLRRKRKIVMSNLSDKGRLYHNHPSLDWISQGVYTHVGVDPDKYKEFVIREFIPFKEEEWEIERLE